MNAKHFMFLGFVLAAGLTISLILGGANLGSEETEVVNTLTVMREYNIGGLFTFSAPNMDFFLVGIRHLTSLDFAFFSGPYELLWFFLVMTIGAGITFGMFVLIIGFARGWFTR